MSPIKDINQVLRLISSDGRANVLWADPSSYSEKKIV